MNASINEQIRELGFLQVKLSVKKSDNIDEMVKCFYEFTSLLKKVLEAFLENYDGCEISAILKRPDLEEFALEEIKKRFFKMINVKSEEKG